MICKLVACLVQSTFHSRMPDVACNLAPVWTVRTICQHRPYRPIAHRLYCMFMLEGVFPDRLILSPYLRSSGKESSEFICKITDCQGAAIS